MNSELINIDWTLFRADGFWHPIGHGIEVMAHSHMAIGTFYIRAVKTPCTGEVAQGEQTKDTR